MPFLAEDIVEYDSTHPCDYQARTPSLTQYEQFSQDQPLYVDATSTDVYWTANQCKRAIQQIAAGFQKILKLQPGDCVCIQSFKHINYPVLVNGIIGFGGVYTGCNPNHTKFELGHHLETSKAKVAVVELELVETCLKAATEVGFSREKILLFAEKGTSAEKQYGLRSWRELFEHGEMDWPRFDDIETAKNTTAALLYSSGTTGLPKAAMLSHHNMIAQYVLFFEWKGTQHLWKKHRIVALPIPHAATAPLCHFSPLYSGDKMFVLRRFELESFLYHIEKHQITEGAFVPPVVHAIICSPLTKKYSLKSIRHAQGGAAPLDAGSQARLKALLAPDAPFTQVWGMTETSCTCSCIPFEEGDETTGYVGRMVLNMDAKRYDVEGNDISDDDLRGELCVRGPLVVKGYYENPEANKRTWNSEGFFHTGDVACGSRQQIEAVVEKELIEVRGFQVAPTEVEAALLFHPNIVEAAVIGIPAVQDGDGEEPRAYITMRPGANLTEQAVNSFLEERLARYKQCTGGIVFMENTPMSLSSKQLKRVLREGAKKELASAGERAKM